MAHGPITGSWIVMMLLLILAAFSDLVLTGRRLGFGGGGLRGGWARSGSSRSGYSPMGGGGYYQQGGYYQPGSSNQGMKMAGAAAMGAVVGGAVGYGMGSADRPYRYRYSGYGYRSNERSYYSNPAGNESYDFSLGDPYSAAPRRSCGLQHMTLLSVCAMGFGNLVWG